MAHLYEEIAVVASIPPAVASATTHNTDVVDMKRFERVLVVACADHRVTAIDPVRAMSTASTARAAPR
jgi:hypothetical protein